MSATVPFTEPVTSNRRRNVRQKVHAPAYASFGGASKDEMLDLYEVLDISEGGVAVQCPSELEIGQQVNLCLDLAESSDQIVANARVVWSDATGRAGLGFPALSDVPLRRLREWLFLNAMAGAANAASAAAAAASVRPQASAFRPNYTDILTAASAVQREAESLGNNLEAVLGLIVRRSHSLLRASGAAIAMAENDASTMTCKASSGAGAPPVGAILQVGSGFSGECVRTGRMLRCNDAEIDNLVDRESCRVLGIRSLLAVPIGSGEKVMGLLEVFSAKPNVFSENDCATLQRFANTISEVARRAARSDDVAGPAEIPAKPFLAPGSILFVSEPAEKGHWDKYASEEETARAIHLPRRHLYLLYCSAATIFLVLGFTFAPWVQERSSQIREPRGEQTVLASSKVPSDAPPAAEKLSIASANLEQLRELAKHGNPAAENALGLLYAQGDEKQAVAQDEREAVRWFTKAAEDGSVPAQYKLGLLYWGGHGVAKDVYKAYFWAVLARAGGQDGSQDLARVLANSMRRAQANTIEQQAEIWYQQHESRAKPKPGR